MRIAYTEAGDGDPPLVLMHGMASNRADMNPLLDRLSRRHRVVSMDLRGHGDSDLPADGDYTVEASLRDIAAIVADRGLTRPVLIGHSWGATLSAAYARTHPVRGFVMLDPGLQPQSRRRAELEPYYATLGGADHAERVRAFVRPRLVDQYDAVDAAVETMAHTDPRAYLGTARAALNCDVLDLVRDIDVPGLLVLARRPLTDADGLAALSPRIHVAQVVGAGHFLQLSVPEQVVPMIERFLEMACT